MRRTAEKGMMVLLCVAVSSCSHSPSPKDTTDGAAVPEIESEAASPETAKDEANTPDLAQARPDAPGQREGRRENLTCYAGSEDRHARIGVELVNDQVTYFAYYSKWRPRTCSIEAGRGDAFSRWADNGKYSTVTLADRKGELRIEHKGGAYRFGFFNVDRVRYCGMPGKINGSLTVTRGKSSCVVEGVMDGHSL